MIIEMDSLYLLHSVLKAPNRDRWYGATIYLEDKEVKSIKKIFHKKDRKKYITFEEQCVRIAMLSSKPIKKRRMI